MAKSSKSKKRSVSIHSRAARRAASPSLDTDKSPRTTTNRHEDLDGNKKKQHFPALSGYTGGITKKRKQKQMSSAQRLRLKKGIERAGIVAGTMEKKVQRAVGRHKAVKSRRSDWEDLNAKIEVDDAVIQVGEVQGVATRNPFVGLKMDEGRDRIPLPEPGEELVLPLMMSRPPPRTRLQDEIT